MKITKTNKMHNGAIARRTIANKGCDVCPCCGENKDAVEYMEEGIFNKGIFSGIVKDYCKGFFKMKYMQIDCYSCETCGAEWESEPYEV